MVTLPPERGANPLKGHKKMQLFDLSEITTVFSSAPAAPAAPMPRFATVEEVMVVQDSEIIEISESEAQMLEMLADFDSVDAQLDALRIETFCHTCGDSVRWHESECSDCKRSAKLGHCDVNWAGQAQRAASKGGM